MRALSLSLSYRASGHSNALACNIPTPARGNIVRSDIPVVIDRPNYPSSVSLDPTILARWRSDKWIVDPARELAARGKQTRAVCRRESVKVRNFFPSMMQRETTSSDETTLILVKWQIKF